MRTPAELVDHYDRNLRPGLSQPQAFAAWYKHLDVLSASGHVHVSVHKYRMNSEDPNDLDENGRVRDAHADRERGEAIQSVQTWLRGLRSGSGAASHATALTRLGTLQMIASGGAGPRRLRRVFNGKGGPRDIALALGMLEASGRIATAFPGVDARTALQSYCDRFIGVDCSGFVNGYFTAIGRRTDDLTDRPGIASYARARRRLAAIPGAPRNHVFCWVKGESRTSVRPGAAIRFAHILLIDEWVSPPNPATLDPVGATFRCSQSSASLGGITTGVYEIERGPSSGRRARTWRIRRVPGLGDNVLEPSTSVWNDVFLAPPF